MGGGADGTCVASLQAWSQLGIQRDLSVDTPDQQPGPVSAFPQKGDLRATSLCITAKQRTLQGAPLCYLRSDCTGPRTQRAPRPPSVHPEAQSPSLGESNLLTSSPLDLRPVVGKNVPVYYGPALVPFLSDRRTECQLGDAFCTPGCLV